MQEIAHEKVSRAYEILKKPVVVMDAGFYIHALRGFPRAYVHFALETIGIEGMLKLAEGFASWIPALQEIQPGDFTMARYYAAVASYYRERTFAQFNSAFDHVQVFYYTAGGRDEAGFGDALQGAIDNIHANAPNFRSYTAEGSQHCIMPRPDFYRRDLNGVSFRDWVENLAKGVEVESVRCDDCVKK